MRRVAQVATLGFGALMAFQVALAAGAPLGHAAWGGSQAHLTAGQRIGSAAAVVFYVAAIIVVRASHRASRASLLVGNPGARRFIGDGGTDEFRIR